MQRQAFEVLEPCAGKLASSVLRGRSGSNATLLPDFLGMNQDHKILYVWNGGKDGQIETIAYWVVKRESRNHMKHIDFDQ